MKPRRWFPFFAPFRIFLTVAGLREDEIRTETTLLMRIPALPSAAEPVQMLREDGTPYYVQLAAIIRRQIADETWNVGDRLPTLKDLVATFGVSPMTVRHALAGLEKEGLISAERGRGTFVKAKPEMPASVPYGLTSSQSRAGSGLWRCRGDDGCGRCADPVDPQATTAYGNGAAVGQPDPHA